MGRTQQTVGERATFTAPPGQLETRITRAFDAPRSVVYWTMLDPRKVPHFWGPGNVDTHVDLWEVRPGGVWRIIQVEPNGKEHVFHGVYHDVVEQERTVATMEYEGRPRQVVLETITFDKLGEDRTWLTMHSVFQSLEARDAMVDAGAARGAVALLERLAKLVERPQYR